MTAANPLAPRRTAPPPDRTGLLVLIFLLTSALLLLSHNSDVLGGLGGLGAFLRNPIVEAIIVSLFLANVLFAYLWRAAPWARALVGLGSLLLVLPWAGQEDTSLLDLSIQIMIFAALALWLVSRILQSPFGAAIEAIRENERRARTCGYDVERTKLLSFALSGSICALAGAMSALHLAFVPLDVLNYQTSGMIVMMTLLARDGSPKVVPECSYPLTGVGCVSRVYTDRTVLDLTDEGVVVRDLFGTTYEELAGLLDVPLLDRSAS